jgi:hypothetical protein
MTSGPRVAHARSSEPEAIAAELRDQLCGDAGAPQLVIFFASSKLDFAATAAAIARALPDSRTLGCTTCGEIGSGGCTVGRVAAIAFDAPTRGEAVLLDDLKYEHYITAIEDLIDSLDASREAIRERPQELVFVSLVDGLGATEERLLAALARSAPGVPVVGGSAADDFAFRATAVALDGQVAERGAVLALLEPGLPFAPFLLHHYERGGQPIVVTDADPEGRLITRLDGYPAISYLAKLTGVDEQTLRADPLATLGPRQVVFGVEVGSTTFLRSVMNIRGDALLMGGALEDGALIYPMVAGDLVAATREGLDEAMAQLSEPAALLLFNCGGRIFEAIAKGIVDELAEAMCPLPAAGFTTYGEQFGPLQINHTLTGLVFGRSHGG